MDISRPMLDLKQSALQIFRETLAAIDIPATMRRKLAREDSRIHLGGAMLDLALFERICAMAIGKASVAMACGLTELLSPDFRAEGIVVTPSLTKVRLRDSVRLLPGILFPTRAASRRPRDPGYARNSE